MTIIASNFWSISLKLYPLLENTLVCDIVFDKIQIFVICEGKMLSTGESLLLPKREIKFSASQVYSYSGTTTTTCGDDELFSHHAMQKRREIFELFAHKLLLIQWPWKICMKENGWILELDLLEMIRVMMSLCTHRKWNTKNISIEASFFRRRGHTMYNAMPCTYI